MDYLKLDDEQQMLMEAVDRFLNKRIKPLYKQYNNVAIPRDVAGQLVKELADFGFIAGTVPKDKGGLGLSFRTHGMLIERLSMVFPALAGLVFITSSMAAKIGREGTDQQYEAYFQRMLSGELIGAGAITEPAVGSNPAEVTTSATRSGDDWIINGEKCWISNGGISDLVVVIARTGPERGNLSRFIVERADGYSSSDIPKMAMGEWPTSIMRFDNVRIPAWRQMGRDGSGLMSTLRGFEVARCYVALLSVGIAQAALEVALEYAKQRVQWGKPIGQHQLVQDMLAEMATQTDAARLLAYRGLSLVDQGVRCDTQTSMAKWFATEMAVKVTSMAVQIHGAYGISTEYPVERYFREARILTIPDGTTQIQKLIIGRNLTGLSAF
ncbi:MAG: acyl-CoA dehydrogenase family protein [Pseudomonadota bacterium]|jgi:alkylation response protein AidB-like acyl-CoA dehydrogenase